MNSRRILIVEDEGIVALDIQNRLAAMGYRPVGCAATSEEAVALVEERRPDLVLMDISLQGANDGIAAAEEIRLRFRVPVIFLTAYSKDATLERAKLAEPFGYILKPFNDRELKSTIEIALYKHRAEEEIRRMNRLFDVLSQVNQAVVRTRSREDLLLAVCRQVVERGAIDLAWIGRLDPDTSQIVPVASFGSCTEILSDADFYANERPEGQGSPGKAIREGRPFVCNECGSTDCPYPASKAPARFGFQSCASFPLRFQGQVYGALSLCVAQPGFFREREIELLREVAMDVSFALDKIEGDAQREHMSEQYQRQSVFLRTLMDSMPFPVFYKDARLRYLGCNTAFEQFVGIKRDHIVGKPVHGLWPKDLADMYDCTDREVLASTNMNPLPLIFEGAIQAADGVRYDVLIHKAVFRDQDGGVGGIIGAMEDITERKRADAALRTSEERLRAIIDNANGLIWVKDLDGRFLIINRYMEELTGVPQDRQIGRTVHDLWPQDLADEYTRNDRRVIESGEPMELEEPARLQDGEHTFYSVKFPLRDSNGRIYALGAICTDITERKRAEAERTRVEAQLRQAQKMEALGTLSGGIAHDFNNILGIIVGYAEMANWRAGEGSRVQSDLQHVLDATNRAKELVQQILTFSRRSEQEKKPLRLGLIVKETLKMLRASLPSTVVIKQNVASEAVVMADPTQMHQVMMNLGTNAAHAMRENGGMLEISLTDASLGPESIVPHSGLQPGPYVRLTVKDTGHGIDPAIQDRIFDPFFTTKEQGVGTGLGLAVVHGIVKSYAGAIKVESVPGNGAAFQVLLPAMESSPEPAAVKAAPLPRGRERILIVDDEPELAMAPKEILEHLGYEVYYRTNGMEALQTFRHQLMEKPFDMVVTDLTMPHLTGVDLTRELLALEPNLPIILCTGFSEKMNAAQARSLGIQGFLMKPVVIRELAEMIREVLDKR